MGEKGYTRYIGYSGDGGAARYAIECGAFDTLQTSINIADQEAIELTLPLARERRSASSPSGRSPTPSGDTRASPRIAYHQPYWERLQKLEVRLSEGRLPAGRLDGPAVHPGRAGGPHGDRRHDEARPLARERRAAGRRAVAAQTIDKIPLRWRDTADSSWVGQI